MVGNRGILLLVGDYMKNVVISDSRQEELQGFMDGLNTCCNEKFEIGVHLADLTMKGVLRDQRRYLAYFLVPVHYFANRKKYKIIIGWQQFYALILCYYCSLFRVKKNNIIIAMNFTYKERRGILKKIYYNFMKRCVEGGYLDLIHVPSRQYADQICSKFNFPRDRVIVTPFGIADNYDLYSKLGRPRGYEKKRYFLSIGRSNRDYNFLIEAWKDIHAYLVVASDAYKKTVNNEWIFINNSVTADEQYSWISNAEGIILPIDDPTICSGDTVLLQAMCMQKIVVVTQPSTLAEMYIKDEENGLLIEKDPNCLKSVIKDIVIGKYNDLGREARKCFLDNFTRKKMGESLARTLDSL